MIQEAFISGQIGKAVYLEDDLFFLMNDETLDAPVECHPIDISTFFSLGAEIKTLSNGQLNAAYLKSQLVAQRQEYRALTLAISGMDRVLDYDTRKAAITTAENLIRRRSTHRFVRARLLARPAPEEADVETAIDIAIHSNAPVVRALYQFMLEHDRALALVYETWVKASQDYFLSHAERVEGQRILTDLGVFADMASTLTANNIKALGSLVVTYGQKPEISSQLSRGVHILNDLKARLINEWPSPTRKRGRKTRTVVAEAEQLSYGDDPVSEMLAQFESRRENARSRVFTADQAKEKVDHQIEAIGKLIVKGNINRADSYLRDLISFHVEHSEKEHLGMSLCSLAKIAIDARSFEIAERMVDYALLLGIDDVVISTTQAQVFKSMGDFDKALAVYEETMARFPNDEVARGGYAEVLKSMGDFDKALAVCEETTARFPNNEIARNGYAGILILFNRFDTARSLLSDARLKTKQDWIDYHLIAMSYIKSEEIDEAIRRLTYGLKHTPWPTQKNYFLSALAVAKIRTKEFDEVVKILPTNVVNIDVFQRQTRLALVGHSQAALGKNEEAVQTLAKLDAATNPHVINLKEAISRRYMLGQSQTTLSVLETHALDLRILEQEYFLAQAA